MDIDLAALPYDVEKLQQIVRSLAAERASLSAAQAEIERLRLIIALWVRVPTGVALIGGGVLGFLPLPIVSIWMLPVGLALLAHDIPTMRRPMARLLHFTNRKIEKWKS